LFHFVKFLPKMGKVNGLVFPLRTVKEHGRVKEGFLS
jgi:hypothetical protein